MNYLLFAGYSAIEPAGGWKDFKGIFISVEAAKDYVLEELINTIEWFHIVDFSE